MQPTLTIPHRKAMTARIMKMGQDTIQGMKQMISVSCCHVIMFRILTTTQELESKVSLSLDAWSSPNGYGFLAIVLHYVTNDWRLGESVQGVSNSAC
jgi:hypothetical protein